ncbi:MAG: PEGA domain-containing protein [Myxococcales bacterium]|nr:PEGA domain-containing protein [Myxococcales bacterium]
MQQPVRSLAVLLWPTLELRPDRLDDLLLGLGEAFRKQYGFFPLTGLSLSRAVWRELDAAPTDCRRQFDRALAEGRSALQALQLTRAKQSLEQAAQHLPWCADVLPAGSAIELFVRRGMLSLSQAQPGPAEAEFRKAVSLDPDVLGQRFALTADAVAVFERARRQLLSGKPTSTVVFSWPEGAAVEVDGRPAGPAPCTLALFPGIHTVRVSLPGHSSWTRILPDDLPPAELRAWLFPLPAFGPPRALLEYSLADDALPAKAQQQLASLAREWSVDGVLLVGLGRGEGGLELQVRLSVPGQNYLGELRVFRVKDPPTPKELGIVVRALREFKPSAAAGPPRK